MVDALTAVHQVLRPGGVMLDVRPSPHHQTRIETERRVVGRLLPNDLVDDLASDDAAREVVGRGLFREIRRAHFWYRFSFADFASFDQWRVGHRRFTEYSGDPLPVQGRITVKRAIAFDEYERI